MITVKDYEVIRKAVLVDGLSQREAARTFGHGRETIKKALTHSEPPGYQRHALVARPVLDPYLEIIDAWLDDEKARGVPRKQRSNAKVIWERLKHEHGFEGSVYPVRRYMKQRKRAGKAFFPLVFQAGEEGQVDWGEATVGLAGQIVKVHLYAHRLCYSRATYVRAYPAEKLECFLDGHVHAFRFFGGTPRRNAYDNLKSAVTSIGRKGERRLNDRFLGLRSHYLFESRFCNVESGHEKGRVENLVKLAQRTFLAGAPSFTGFDDLNVYLEQRCLDDLSRLAPKSERTRGELFEEERGSLIPLHNGDFDACITRSTFAGKEATLSHLENVYSVPVRYAYNHILLKAYADRIELWHKNTRVASHARCWEKHRYILDYRHYIPLLERKPGGLQNGRPFMDHPWGEELQLFRTQLEYRYQEEGTRKFISLLLLFTEYPEAQVKAAVNECIRRRAFSDDAVKSVLDYTPPTPGKTIHLEDQSVFAVETDGVRRASEYDAVFLEQEVSA